MSDAVAHRGPDGVGYHVDEAAGVYLGHRRLVILDLEGGRQPMWNEDGTVGVVFNGEIYNAAELREELIARGHRFASDHSDTETLVHGYEEWGAALPGRLSGMFAFVIYDSVRRVLFAARDRFGKKPFFYAKTSEGFAFASELTALAEHPEVDRSLDLRAIKKFFAYNFIPAPNSIYRGCRKLPGGCSLTFDLTSRRLDVQTYWQFRIEPTTNISARAEEDWCEELLELLSQAVRRRLVSDVPIGVFLSGGLDSSAILSLCGKYVEPNHLKSFTIAFREPSYDESAYARQAAEFVGCRHFEEHCSIHEARELAPDILRRMDEPLGDPSLLPCYMLSRFARRHITVALGGDGADELFAGYDPFKALQPAAYYERFVPRPVHLVLRRVAECLPMSCRNMSLDFKVRRTLAGLTYPRPFWNPVWLGALEPADIADLFHEPVDLEDLYSEALDVWRSSDAGNLIDRTLEFYTRLYLQDDILVKLDRSSMMNSLEARSPFLDNDVVDFARRLPANFKYRRGKTKYLLRKTLSRLLPASIMRRRKKGFGIPLTQWLREWPADSIANSESPIPADWTQRRWQDHRAGRADHRHFLWSSMAFELRGKSQAAGALQLAAA
jgi:asparagine synthase (glutamine-hydrolysing)